MSHNIYKNEIDHLLFEVAKRYKKICKNHSEPVMMVIVGGGVVLLTHTFRNKSYDIDSLVYGNSVFKEAIKDIANKYDLPYDWINSDFKNTESYSEELARIAKPYKLYCNVLNVFIVDDEYLIAMKLKAFRSYKHDKSDIVGILKDMHDEGKSVDIQIFEDAYFKLYKETIPKESYEFLFDQLKSNKFLSTYEQVGQSENAVGVRLRPMSKTIRDSKQLSDAIKTVKTKMFEEKIINELGVDKGKEENLIVYKRYLYKKFSMQNIIANYDEFLKEELNEYYDLFCEMLNQGNDGNLER